MTTDATVTIAIERMLLVPHPNFGENAGEQTNLFGYLIRCVSVSDREQHIEHWPLLRAAQKEEA